MRTITKTIRLHKTQSDFTHSPALYRCFCGGRGSGKSWAAVYDLVRRAKRGRTYLVAAPTYPMLFDSEFRTFTKLARELSVLKDVKTSPPHVTLSTGAEILFRSADDPDRLRGPNLSGVVLMEASLMAKDAYDICIACLREGGEQGWLSAAMTPAGPTHWTFDVFATGRPDTALFRAPTRANPFLPAGFQKRLEQQFGRTPFARQELDGEFVQIEGAVFPAEWLDAVLVPEWPEGGIVSQVLYLDPSQGKDSKSSDLQAFCRAGFWPGDNNQNLVYLNCHAAKEPPPDMVARAVRMCKERRPDLFAFETNGTLGLLEAEVMRQLREAHVSVLTRPVTNTDPKRWRIKNALMPYLAQKRLRIVDNPGGRLLRAQLTDEPHSEHDDASDAAAGSITELERLVLR